MIVAFTSAVVPGWLSTMEVSWPVMRFMRVDFPAFMRPQMQMLSRTTSSLGRTGRV